MARPLGPRQPFTMAGSFHRTYVVWLNPSNLPQLLRYYTCSDSPVSQDVCGNGPVLRAVH